VSTDPAAPAQPGPANTASARNEPQPNWRQRLSAWTKSAAAAISVLGVAYGVVQSAFIYADQYRAQRGQNFLQAFDLADAHLGASVSSSVIKAIEPFYKEKVDDDWKSARKEWQKARDCYDRIAAATGDSGKCIENSEAPGDAQKRYLDAMQASIVEHLLIRGGTHDDDIHNYQFALDNIRFLYEYGRTSDCDALVVLLKFQKNADDFYYYYPGSFDVETAKITASRQAGTEQQFFHQPEEKIENIRLGCFDDLNSLIPQGMIRGLLYRRAPG
jgi:hypothetical protein